MSKEKELEMEVSLKVFPKRRAQMPVVHVQNHIHLFSFSVALHFANLFVRLQMFTGRVSSDDNYRVCSRVSRLQREHRFMNFNCPTRE